MMNINGKLPKGPFTLWENFGYEGWGFRDFATLKEAIVADKHGSDWVVTRPIHWSAVETSDK